MEDFLHEKNNFMYDESISIPKDDIHLIFLKKPPVQYIYPNVDRIKLNKRSKELLEKSEKKRDFVIPLESTKILKRRSLDDIPPTKTTGVSWRKYKEEHLIRYLKENKDEILKDEEVDVESDEENLEKPKKKRKKVIEKNYDYNNIEHITECTIKIQRLSRKFLAKRIIEKLKKKRFLRMKKILEFYTSELRYLSDMNTFNEVYFQHFLKLEEKNKSPISMSVINHIFSGLKTIVSLSEQFVQNLQKSVFIAPVGNNTPQHILEKNYNHFCLFGKVLMNIAHYLKMYMNYCNKYSRNLEIITQLMKKNKKFSNLINKLNIDKRTDQLGINSYLFKPIQRVLKYKLFLKDLIKNTHENHPDYLDLKKSQKLIRVISRFLNNSIKEIEKSKKVLQIQKLFVKNIDIYTPHRKFITFRILYNSKKSRVFVHLFSDIICFSYKNKFNKFKLISKVPLKHTNLFYSRDIQYKRLIRVNHLVLVCENEKHRNNFLSVIFRQTQKNQNNRNSSSDDQFRDEEISELLQPEEDFSLSVDDCVRYVKRNPITMMKYVNSFDTIAKKVFTKLNIREVCHPRNFVVDKSETKIVWASKKKSLKKSSLQMDEIRELVIGQTTRNFRKFPKPELEGLSFSLLYGKGNYLESGEFTGESLDLICENKNEFEIIITAIRFFLQDKRTTLWKRINADDDNFVISKKRLFFDKKKKKKKHQAIGDAYSFGRGQFGLLSHGDEKDLILPKVVFNLLLVDVKTIQSGTHSSVALASNGKPVSWGKAKYSGHGEDNTVIFRPKPLSLFKISKISVGQSHILFLGSNGTLYGTGENNYGQLGETKKGVSKSIVVVMSNEKYPVLKSVSAGYSHSGAITSSGLIYTFGKNDEGQLGDGSRTNKRTPEIISELKAKEICFGCFHSLALTHEGNVYAWGSNSFGSLGVDKESSLFPIQIPNLKSIISVSSGTSHNLAINQSGECFAWGELVGSSGKKKVWEPKKITKVLNKFNVPMDRFRFVQSSCGANHSIAIVEEITSNGVNRKVVTFGNGNYGRLGQGNEKDYPFPKEVSFFSKKKVFSVSSGCSSFQSFVVCAHKWVDDGDASKCMNKKCNKKFNPIRRRHHCRFCGAIFCGKCSAKRITILMFGFDDDVRVCDNCFKLLSKKKLY